VVGVLCTGEIRGQVAFSNNWNFGTVLSTVLSGGNAVPPTPSAATGSAQVVVSRDGTMGMAFLGVSGGLALGFRRPAHFAWDRVPLLQLVPPPPPPPCCAPSLVMQAFRDSYRPTFTALPVVWTPLECCNPCRLVRVSRWMP
jgi:hypothetical protein